MSEQVQLKLAKVEENNFLGKALSNIGKAVYSSGSGLYFLLISAKRNSILKHFIPYKTVMEIKDEKKRDSINSKYKKAYENYLDTLERYVTETIYTKMQKRISSLDEEKIMSSYYEINALKGLDQVEYKNKMQILLLNMEWNILSSTKSEKYLEKYKEFYIYHIENLYKSSMRHSTVLLANGKEGDKDKFNKIYDLIEKYIQNVLPILPENEKNTKVLEDYKKYVTSLDMYAKKEYLDLRKKLSLLEFSRVLFVYSFPMVALEECYKEILNSARICLENAFIEADKFEAYQVLLDSIEEYSDNILIIKQYWNTIEEEERYKKFQAKWSELKKLARIDYDDFKNQREILFIKNDLQTIKNEKLKVDNVRDYYRFRMLQLHALRNFSNNYKIMLGKWKSRRRQKADENISVESEDLNREEVK